MHYRILALSAAMAFTISAASAQAPFSDDSLIRMPDRSQSQPFPGNLSTASGGSISGNVRSSDNRPISNAKVEIRDLTNGEAVAYGYTGPSGSFELSNVPTGSYEVVATSGLSEAHEDVRMEGTPVQFTLRLPHTDASSPGQQTVSMQQLRIPEKAQSALKKAQDAVAKGKFDEARQQLAKALAIEPHYSEALALSGIVDLQTGDLNSAAGNLQKAIQMDNNNAMAYVAMGSIYNVKNQFDDALRELDRGIALNPTAWQAHYEISRAELGKADFVAALREAEKAQELMGPREFAPLHLAKANALVGMKSYSDAVTEFQKFLNEDKDSPAAPQVRQAMESAKSFVEAKK
jgi:tetratricopeptide (TPR) repeat protein